MRIQSAPIAFLTVLLLAFATGCQPESPREAAHPWDTARTAPSASEALVPSDTAAAAPADTLAAGSTTPVDSNRIRFAPGASSARVAGSLGPEDSRTYRLHARRGQTLHVAVTGTTEFHDVVLSIVGPDGEDLMGDEAVENAFEGTLPMTGDYRITVDMIESEHSDYTLEVSVK